MTVVQKANQGEEKGWQGALRDSSIMSFLDGKY